MDRLVSLLEVSEDAVFELCLRVPIEELEGFFIAYPEFLFLSSNRVFMNLLAELNDVPYSTELNKLIEYSKMNANKKLFEASKNGDIRSVERMIELVIKENVKLITNYNRAMYVAAQGGHIEIVQMMLDLGATNYNGAMISAAYGGHTEIVEYLKEVKRSKGL